MDYLLSNMRKKMTIYYEELASMDARSVANALKDIVLDTDVTYLEYKNPETKKIVNNLPAVIQNFSEFRENFPDYENRTDISL